MSSNVSGRAAAVLYHNTLIYTYGNLIQVFSATLIERLRGGRAPDPAFKLEWFIPVEMCLPVVAGHFKLTQSRGSQQTIVERLGRGSALCCLKWTPVG